MNIYIYIHIYIYRKRERERDANVLAQDCPKRRNGLLIVFCVKFGPRPTRSGHHALKAWACKIQSNFIQFDLQTVTIGHI